ncbi:MAG: putative AlkP superfamily pyrophosphatase or phosphodiesterase [Marivirga sp.]
MSMKYIIFLLSILLLSCESKTPEQQYVILISFDGFRHDYVEQFDTPNFDKFIETGVASKHLVPSFPTKTFPNHYTIVTGLYPAHHGLVDNNFYDPSRKTIYGIKDREKVNDVYYYGGNPIWSYVHQYNLKSASYFWVGSEVNDKTMKPDYSVSYDGSIPNTDRVDQVIKWLKLPEQDRPQFICLYFSVIDSNGHQYGPLSKENEAAVQEADSLVGRLKKQLENIDLPVNVIITADHGMKAIDYLPANFIKLNDYISLDNQAFITASSGTHAQLYFDDKSLIDSVYNSLKLFSDTFDVYKKGQFPTHWHYNEANDRIGDLIVSAPYGKNFITKDLKDNASSTIGAHGYDPINPDMHTIFYANGPSIKNGLLINSFENIDIYPFICDILNLPIPEDIDGKLNTIGEAIKKP